MKTDAIRFDLQDKIAHADERQLEDIYGLITNYLNGEHDESGWNLLSDSMKARLTASIAQAHAGLGREAGEVLKDMR